MSSTSSASRLLWRSLNGLHRESRKSYSTTNIIPKDISREPTSSSSSASNFLTKDFEEIKFNVPWGHVSGKWYGPKNVRPIVGFHGWQDNAGTFDTIAPLLPSHLGFLAIDLPGHGLSSWLPNGCTYHAVDYVTFVLTMMREFGWEKISMICHSMSAINGFVFSSLYPDKCDMYIALDVLKPLLRSKEVLISTVGERLETLLKVGERHRSNKQPPSYDFDELVDRLHEGSGKSINKDCCQFILQRNVRPSPNDPTKFSFSRDERLKSLLFYALPQELVCDMAQRITCPHLFIKALQAPYYEDKSNYDEVINVLTQKPTFEYHQIDGTHHVHLNEPHKLANIINPFINKHRPAPKQ
ncbi:probable serine hydrolase [Eupeodes corollae]|uniref:probable serine hydrolase n=1 Tax=Eupeodes corollae TaxID=290404 RepID=UPI002491CBB5|nr:probable serine hydrolase [Eupeodes corollae]